MVSERVLRYDGMDERRVLILVLLEDGLGGNKRIPYQVRYISLNPCFTGRWSRRTVKVKHKNGTIKVLILVLLEDGLGD